jgi:hypothetical protein
MLPEETTVGSSEDFVKVAETRLHDAMAGDVGR